MNTKAEIIRQLLLDWPDRFPNRPTDILARVDRGDTAIERSYSALRRALRKMRGTKFDLYIALRNIYLHEYAGHSDRDFLARKLGNNSALLTAERLAVQWLVKELNAFPLVANFPDQMPRKRPVSVRERYPEFVKRLGELKLTCKPTKAIETCADEFGVSPSTIKRADRWSRGRGFS